jgi:hypothetical protein
MSIRRFVEIGVAAHLLYILTATPAAAAACCDHAKNPCCGTPNMACCETINSPVAAAVLIPQVAEPKAREMNMQEPRPSRETLTVWFMKPVKVGDRILLGKYVIEHDNVRMARGRPCTYIYAADDLRLPVVAFRCAHLHRPPGERASVTLRPLHEANGMQEFREFQFAGEAGAHGLPAGR